MRALLCCFAAVLAAAPAPPPLAGQARLDARVAVFGTLAKRNAAFAGSVGTASGTLTGMELSAHRPWVGISARLFGGTFTADSGTAAAGKVANGDLRISVGQPVISGVLGYGRRGFTGGLGTISWSFIQFGVRSTVPLGSTGLEASFAVSLYGGVKNIGGAGKGSGKEAMTALTFLPARAPFFVMLGYRIEQFTATGGSGDRPEDVGGIVLGGGFRLTR
jgi:hypothetical protein